MLPCRPPEMRFLLWAESPTESIRLLLSLSSLHLGSNLFHNLIDVALWILGDAEDWLGLSSQAIGADGAYKFGTSSALTLLELRPQPDLTRGGEEGEGAKCPEGSIKVNTGPDEDGATEGEEEEGGRGKGKCELGDEIGDEVVVFLLRRSVAADGIEEERADVSPAIWTTQVSTKGDNVSKLGTIRLAAVWIKVARTKVR